MGSRQQLSAGEAFDDLTSQPVGDGFLTLRTSAGNRLTFRSPAEAYRYQQANKTQVPRGTYNDQNDKPA